MTHPETRLGLPEGISAALFDLDGVLTSTAELHERAWKQVFDEFLEQRGGPQSQPFTAHDYDAYVDGLPRLDGVRSFLKSRHITLPEEGDGWTVHGIGDRKDAVLHELIEHSGVHVYPGSQDYLAAVRAAGLRTGVVSSSANAAAVLAAARLSDYAEVRVDGKNFAEEGLRGKPAPDGFLAAAARLQVRPPHTAVFEDAVAGVAAGHAGGFGFVVGIDRVRDGRQAAALRDAGADRVVTDLSELTRS
ncbi:beta-phosphoglucomutase family hydrolase [Nocardia yunnanensis]|uniref:Beta-phosphoglucomutase n=1 Tax=Nocardia yunnanensis TaxID=2382165 RepID=A0A386ZDA8_9NOCA|nr:beta-phosphoglucomutase family hydrolase [Nocardia yunnanensis]AYF75852.1 beta-phosphoglucomutase family hydrolase [Nocardia yunnanensis]